MSERFTPEAQQAMFKALERALPVLEKYARPYNHEYSACAVIRAALRLARQGEGT